MKIHPILRIISVIAYLCIFLQGMIIALPLAFLLLFGLFTEEPLSRVFIGLADLALLGLFCLTIIEKSIKTVRFEMVAYFLLLSPLVMIITSVPIHLLNYVLFIVPATCFVVLYPLSVFFSYRDYKKNLMSGQRQTLATGNMGF